ncbi:endospore germination permease [Alkalihalobacillus sp. R86527]|uniref:GerAB/ArcD/ProY family transporter n=1 Tax=Alkalihalobacillus sp. R86527 TaxID=3093863 RepID=UPI00366D309A
MKDTTYNHLTTWQFFLIATNYLIGPTFFVQMSGLIGATKQWSWIPPMLAFLLSLGVIWLWLHLLKRHPGKDLAEITISLLGQKFGFLISLTFIYFFILIASLATRNVGDVITTVSMDFTPTVVFNLLTITVAIYLLSKGLRTMGRTVEILTPFLFIIFWGSLLLVIGEWDTERIIPLPGSFDMNAIGNMTIAFFSFPYLEFLPIIMLIPLTRNIKRTRKSVYLASFVTTLSTIGVVFILLGTIGDTRISNLTYPTMASAQEISLFRTIENLDVFVSAILITTVLIKVSILLYAAFVFMKHVFRFPYKIPLLILLLFTTTAFSMGAHDNIVENIAYAKTLVPIYSVILGILLPLLLLGMSYIRKGAQS